MPKVTCLSGLKKPTVVDGVTTVIVETDEGTPIAVVVESLPGGYSLIPATDPDFNRILRGLGLDQVEVHVRHIEVTQRGQGQLLSGPLSARK